MPELTDHPVRMGPEGKVSVPEFTRAWRTNLASEQETVNTYQAHATTTDHILVKEVLTGLTNEYWLHAGGFSRLIHFIKPGYEACLSDWQTEVRQAETNLPS
jgi:rubrerythrin